MILQPFGIIDVQKMDFLFFVTLLAKKIFQFYLWHRNNGYRFDVFQIKIIFYYWMYFLKTHRLPSIIIHVEVKIAETGMVFSLVVLYIYTYFFFKESLIAVLALTVIPCYLLQTKLYHFLVSKLYFCDL